MDLIDPADFGDIFKIRYGFFGLDEQIGLGAAANMMHEMFGIACAAKHRQHENIRFFANDAVDLFTAWIDEMTGCP